MWKKKTKHELTASSAKQERDLAPKQDAMTEANTCNNNVYVILVVVVAAAVHCQWLLTKSYDFHIQPHFPNSFICIIFGI